MNPVSAVLVTKQRNRPTLWSQLEALPASVTASWIRVLNDFVLLLTVPD